VSAQPKVVYLTGWGRSGSTILNRLLIGDGVAGVGELRLLWQRGVVKRQDCSCGQPWDSCLLWSPVVHSVLSGRIGDGASEADIVDTARGLHELGRSAGRSMGLHLRRRGGAGPEYAQVLGELYRSVAATSGADLIVDSSKDPTQALVARASGANVTVVHVVRDPRAVVWSHQRAKAPPPGATAGTTEKHSPLYVATRWTTRNSFIDRRVEPDIRVRYEDMVADTEKTIHSIFAAAGVDVPREGPGFEHLIAGNPNRFDTIRGKPLHEDAEWRTAQPGGEKRLTKAIAGRLMRRYGYS
jgi:hypothetical protein